jgi:hypothetical protein
MYLAITRCMVWESQTFIDSEWFDVRQHLSRFTSRIVVAPHQRM